MFYKKKSTSLQVTSAQIHMWSMRESNAQLTNNQTDLWEPCVSVCVPWGPLCVCWVRGGRGFNKGAGLVQGCQSHCLGQCNLMGSRWEPPDWTSSSKPTASWCTDYIPQPSSSLWVYSGIWAVRHQIKVTFSLNAALKLFIDHSVSSRSEEITWKHMPSSFWRPLFSVSHQM